MSKITRAFPMLTGDEKAELSDLEADIESGSKKAGEALMRIRDKNLFRHKGTFLQYLQARWGYSKSHAYALIEYATESGNSGQMDGVRATNQGQYDELKKVPKEKQAKVLEEAAKKGKRGRPTAKTIKEAALEIVGKDDEEEEFVPPPVPSAEQIREEEVEQMFHNIHTVLMQHSAYKYLVEPVWRAWEECKRKWEEA